MSVGRTKKDFEDYDGFVEKFKTKLTTDDCYTPEPVYEAVAGYVSERYGIPRSDMVRPFWPGGDYRSFDYRPGCCVVDNPPFSILAAIQRFYLDRGIRFFLFAPSLTCLSARSVAMEVNHLVCDCNIVYENGANPKTSFVTNMDPGTVMESCPELTRRVEAANRAAAKTRSLPRYGYPPDVATAAMFQRYARHGVRLVVGAADCMHVSRLDSQRESKKTIFGAGLLLSKGKAAEHSEAADAVDAARVAAEVERLAAERAATIAWELSERELALQAGLG